MIDIKEFNIPRHILEILLKDRTTGQNILWGTDQYGFDPKSSIEIDQIISGDVIKPRVMKSLEDQKSRTDSKAEVYTPIEIIKKMNDSVDTEESIDKNKMFDLLVLSPVNRIVEAMGYQPIDISMTTETGLW